MRYFVSILFLLLSFHLFSQKKINAVELLDKIEKEGGGILEMKINSEGDTIYSVHISPVIIYPPRTFRNRRERMKYYRLVRNVKKVYPYSVIIKQIFTESEFVLRHMDNNRERRNYINEKEKELKKEFEGDIRNMTYSQGRILIKLVDRQTGNTTYQLVKHFKGGVSAFFWQGIARIFQTNLKYEYDPDGTDKWIEEIVVRIENGQL